MHVFKIVKGLCLVATMAVILTGCGGSSGENSSSIDVETHQFPPLAYAGDNQTAELGETITITGRDNNSSNDSNLQYQWQQLSGPSVVLNNTNNAALQVTIPLDAPAGTVELQLTITNAQQQTSQDTVIITIANNNNEILSIDAGINISVQAGNQFTLSGTTDYSGANYTLGWQQLSGNTTELVNADQFTTSAIAPIVENEVQLVFQLTITNQAGQSVSDEVTVTVSPLQSDNLLTTLILAADPSISPLQNEMVTFGLPLLQGLVTSTDQIQVSANGQVLPIYVEPGLRWHNGDNSLRSVTIQLQSIDMSQGEISVSITNNGRDKNTDLAKRDIKDGWLANGENKAGLLSPRIYALHSPAYLAKTGLIPPYSPSTGTSDPFTAFQQGQFEQWSGGLNFNDSSAANWLFDRATAYFKAYMSTGSLAYLKEGILSKQFYFNYVRNDNSSPAPAGGRGCWTYKGVACADGKYIAPQQAKLAWALLGDNTQWDNSLIIDMALQSDLGWNQYGSRDPFNQENEGFTERGAGIAGLADLAAWEITGDQTLLTHINQRIASLADMQQTTQAWDVTNNWLPKTGAFEHNLDVHEGNHSSSSAPSNDSSSRGFSPWMSENIADFLWQSYWLTKNNQIPEMLRLLGHAINQFGFTTTYNSQTGAFDTRPAFIGQGGRTSSCNAEKSATDMLYLAVPWADNSVQANSEMWRYYTDTHSIEVILPLASAYYFETDSAKQNALKARLDKLTRAWAIDGCSSVFAGVYRLFNWQHRSNSYRTWQFINTGFEGNNEPVAPQPPVTAPGSSASTELSFTDKTAELIDFGPYATKAFWIGLPDTNADGCLDLFSGTHSDAGGVSQMWLQQTDANGCTGFFKHYANEQANYSQSPGGRITSRYIFTNVTGNAKGLPDFFGSDADGGDSVIYPISNQSSVGGKPVYDTELVGCRSGKARCSALDINGDGNLEFIVSSAISDPRRRVYNPLTNETLIEGLASKDTPGYDSAAYLIIDVNDDSWPDIVSGEAEGYWPYLPQQQSLGNFVHAFPELANNIGDCRQVTPNMQIPIDYDNDGDFDVLFGAGKWAQECKNKEFYLSLHRNNGDGSFTDVTEVAGAGSWTDGSLRNQDNWTTYGGIFPGDFNNDGLTDFMTMTQSYSNSPRYFKNNGDGTFTKIKSLIKNGGAGVDLFRPWGNIGDFNNDGFLDVAILSDGVGHVDGLRLYQNNGNGNNWIKIRARGLGNNTDGYHTKFIIKDAATKAIIATRALGHFNLADIQLIAHAGLGKVARIDLEVQFPHDGPTYHYQNLPANQELVVFRDGCLLTQWKPGSGWPLNSSRQTCTLPSNTAQTIAPDVSALVPDLVNIRYN